MSQREPIDNDWKGEVSSKNKTWKMIGQIFSLVQSKRANSYLVGSFLFVNIEPFPR